MGVFKLAATSCSPEVVLDIENGRFVISGESYPQDVYEVYQPILEWIEQHKDQIPEKAEFHFYLEYFNTTSFKAILEVLSKLDELYNQGKEIQVKWLYSTEDDDMESAGQEYADLVDVPVQLEAID